MQLLNRYFASGSVGRQWLDSAHGTALRLFSVGANMAIAIVSARLLGDESFGTYVSYLAIGGLLATATSMGLPTLLAREIAICRGSGEGAQLRPISQLILALHGLLLLAILVAAVIGNLPAAWILAFAFATNVFAVAMHVFIGFERVLLSQWLGSVLRPMLLLGGFVGVAFFATLSIGAAMWVQVASALIAAAALWLVWLAQKASMRIETARKEGGQRVTYVGSLATGGKFAIAQLAINGMTQVDILILTALRPAEEVAWYYAAARAAMVVSFFFSSVSKMAEPKLVRLWAAGDKREMRSLATSTAQLGFGMTCLAMILALALGRFYLDIFGEEYRSAFTAMMILIVGQLALSFFGPAQPVLRAARSDNRILIYAVSSVVVGSGIAFALIGPFGMNGVAIGMAVQFGLFGLLLARRAHKETGIAPWLAWRTR